MRALAPLVAVALVATPALADAPAPPKLYLQLAASVTDAAFHLDDRDPEGWHALDICRDADIDGCTTLRGSWESRVVADRKEGDEAVVQELRVFQYGSTKQAKRAMKSLWEDFDQGPLGTKRPSTLYQCKKLVIAVTGRFRWHTAGKQLRAHVEAWVDEHCS